jgi:AsmA protein
LAVKSVLKITGYVFAFLISSVVILAFLVDANTFRPRIQTMAAEQGIALNMRGDLHWAFWPAIGLAVNEVSIADSDTPQKIIADVNKASFLVAFIPLMRGDFQVKHILVDGAVIDLEVDEKGVGNWEKLIKKKDKVAAENKSKSAADGSSKELKLSIEKISLHNSQVSYTNLASGQKLALKKITLDMDDVNLEGNPFDVDFSSETELSQTKTKSTPITVKSKLHSSVIIGEGFNSVTLDKGDLSLDVHATDSASLKLQYSVKFEDVKNNLHYQGKLSIGSTNLKQFMAAFGTQYKTENEKALTDISLGGEFQGDKKRVAFTAVNIQVDKTHLKGSLALNDFASQAIVVDLQGDEINVDDYLAPKTDEKVPVAASTATGDEPLIPQELLRKLNADIKLGFGKFAALDLAMEKVLLTINAKNGVVQQQLNASSYSGNIHQKTDLDVRGNSPQTQFDFILQGVEIAPILQAKKLDKKLHLSGAMQANARGQATGASKNQIMASLTGNATFAGAKVRLEPLNIEQQFCKFIALVNRDQEQDKTWNAYTELRELNGKVAIAKGIVTIESLNAGVEKLLLSSTGNINLINGSYDFSLPLKLVRDANDSSASITTSPQGCTVTSNYWAERSMSLLRCKGAYAEINPASDCRPDKDMLNAVIKDFAEYKLKEKYGAKADAKKEELKQKLEEKLGEQGADKAKNLLKNLFKKKEEKTQ